MFNIGFSFKKDGIKKRRFGQDTQMMSQVKKILEQKGQGLILMVRG
jgi:hypothetical protein